MYLKSPTINATRYVDINGVVWKVTFFLLPSRETVSFSDELDKQTNSLSAINEMVNLDFAAGSS